MIANANKNGCRFQTQAIELIKFASDIHIRSLLEDTCLLTRHAKRCTMYPEDLELLHKIRGECE